MLYLLNNVKRMFENRDKYNVSACHVVFNSAIDYVNILIGRFNRLFCWVLRLYPHLCATVTIEIR